MGSENAEWLCLGDSTQATKVLAGLVGDVKLIITSPPYHNAISYESHADNPEANYRERSHLSYANEYLPMLNQIWAECYQLLTPGGLIAINVGTVLDNGYHFPLPQDITSELLNSTDPWEYQRTILWHKVTAGVRRAGSCIQHGLPGYWYPNIMTEHILIFRKPGANTYHNPDTPAEWQQPVWDIAPVPPRTIPHPAPFPEDLPHRLILMHTQPNDIVFDPFLGAGTTAKAAHDLNRVPAGLDIEPTYLEYAKKRLASHSAVRTSQLRVRTISEDQFVPKRSRGKTRHGAGKKATTS